MDYKLLTLCICLLLSANALSQTSGTKQSEQAIPKGIRYTYVSQRWLTEKELSRFVDVGGLSIAVKMRLSNETDWYIQYLAPSTGSVVPVGYHAFRKVGETKWDYTSPARGRECPPGCEFAGDGYRWLELPPGAAIEFEAHNWSNREQEHAFSAFIKTEPNGKPIEVMSDVFRPMSK